MKYVIMECRPGYAVALDENGNFLKVANRQYTVGQNVTDVIPMRLPETKKIQRWLYPLVAMAACLALLLTVFLPGNSQPYASVYVKINPEVRIDVDKNDHVVGLTGINQDGVDLIQGYDYHKKNLDLVTDELVDKAIELGYLTDQGQISISLESTDLAWVENHSQTLSSHLQDHLAEKFVVEILITPYRADVPEDTAENLDDDDFDDDPYDDDLYEDDPDEEDRDDDDFDDDDSDDDDSDDDNFDDDDSNDDDFDDDDSDNDDSDNDDSDDDDSDDDDSDDDDSDDDDEEDDD